MFGEMRRRVVAAAVALAGTLVAAAPASALVSVGQTAPGPPVAACSAADFDIFSLSAAAGPNYVTPSGTLTSWSTNATLGAGQQFTMKVFRKVADPATYTVVAIDGPRNITAGTLNTFGGLSIPVRSG